MCVCVSFCVVVSWSRFFNSYYSCSVVVPKVPLSVVSSPKNLITSPKKKKKSVHRITHTHHAHEEEEEEEYTRGTDDDDEQ